VSPATGCATGCRNSELNRQLAKPKDIVTSTLTIDRSHVPGATADFILDLDAIFDAG
jgi:hypothetical protein